jgi:gamma-glutamylcyclotransferase (GGCT)/AIG2-like uncharacterized protein YtfP
MIQAPNRLFTYGSLRPGYGNFAAISQWVVAHEPATTEGVLISLGAFPALVQGRGVVQGDLLSVEPDAFLVADRIEGCSPDPNRALYIRKNTAVRLASGETQWACAYWYAHAIRRADRLRLVVNEVGGVPIYAWPARSSIHFRST